MIMADYLFHHQPKDSDVSELIPISFCPMTTYHRCLEENAYCIGTRASAKVAGKVAPKVHGAYKQLDLNLKPEHQSKSTRANVAQNQTSQQSGPSKQPSLTVQPGPTPASSVHHCGARPQHYHLEGCWCLLICSLLHLALSVGASSLYPLQTEGRMWMMKRLST